MGLSVPILVGRLSAGTPGRSDEEVKEVAWKRQHRSQARYGKLLAQGKKVGTTAPGLEKREVPNDGCSLYSHLAICVG